MTLPKKIVFQKKQNKVQFKNLDDSEVLSSDFPGLITSATSLNSSASATSLATPASSALFQQRTSWSWWFTQKWPILVLFCGMDNQKSNFSMILAPFLSGAVEACWCKFFEKLVDATEMSKPPEASRHHNSKKNVDDPSTPHREPFSFFHFNMRHPEHTKLLENAGSGFLVAWWWLMPMTFTLVVPCLVFSLLLS